MTSQHGACQMQESDLEDGADCTEQGSDDFCVVLSCVAAQTHCRGCLPHKAWRVGHHPNELDAVANCILQCSLSAISRTFKCLKLSLISDTFRLFHKSKVH